MSAIVAAVAITATNAIAGGGAAEEQREAAREGRQAEERIAERNIEFQKEQAEIAREDFAPWRDIGEEALQDVWQGVQSGAYEMDRFDPRSVNVLQDPGYQFRLEQGVKALDAAAAARGRRRSGAHDKALMRFGQDLASQEYGAAYNRAASDWARESNRRKDRFNMLTGVSNLGQASAAGQAGATGQLASTSGNILSNLGRSQNLGYQAEGQAKADMWNSLSGAVNRGAANYLYYGT